jgi:hypothetical protein
MTKEHIKIYRNKICIRYLQNGVSIIRIFDLYQDAQIFVKTLESAEDPRHYLGLINFQGQSDALIESWLEMSVRLNDKLPTTLLN